MIQSNISNTKTHLSRYLDKVKAGETVLIVDRDAPVAMLSPVRAVGGAWESRLNALAAKGQLRQGDLMGMGERPAPVKTAQIDLVGALLEERRDGR